MIKKQIPFILLVCMLFAGCQSGFIDVSRVLPILEINQLSKGSYLSVAWVDEKTIAFVVDIGNTLDSDGFIAHRPQIEIVDISNKKITPVSIDERCTVYYTRSFQVLPNQQIGYIFECPKVDTVTIQEIKVKNIQLSDIYIESSIGFLGEFAYSSDMRELILVDVNGLYLDSVLYYLDSDGVKTNISPDFIRADFPVWSQKNNLVAFFGTKPYPGSDDQIEHFSQTEKLLDYPWRLYIYNPEDLTTKEIPIDVIGPNRLKWSPDGKSLAFSGEFKGIPGTWLVSNLESPDKFRVTRIVDGIGVFDFSPDGNAIVFAYMGLQNKDKQSKLLIIDIGKLK